MLTYLVRGASQSFCDHQKANIYTLKRLKFYGNL